MTEETKGNAFTNYVKSSAEELTKVTWPTKNQAVRLTIVVIIFCFVVALTLGFVDYLFNELYTYVLDLNN